MPYVEYLFCEKCGPMKNLDIDYQGTINQYIADGKTPATINPPTLVWDYLVYYCPRCQTRFKYTYRDVEFRVRTYFMELSEKYRKYFEEKGDYEDSEDVHISKTIEVSNDTYQRVHHLYTKKD